MVRVPVSLAGDKKLSKASLTKTSSSESLKLPNKRWSDKNIPIQLDLEAPLLTQIQRKGNNRLFTLYKPERRESTMMYKSSQHTKGNQPEIRQIPGNQEQWAESDTRRGRELYRDRHYRNRHSVRKAARIYVQMDPNHGSTIHHS